MTRISLILCTVGRRDDVAAFLDSLLRQPLAADCEVLVIDQNRDDRLVDLIAAYADRLSIRHVRTDTRGLSRARNVGLRLAEGELVGFPDDDCAYPDGYLGHVDQLFREDPGLDALTGHPTAVRHPPPVDDWRAGARTLDRVSVMNRCQEFTIFVRRRSLGGVRFNDLLGVGAGTPWGSDEGPDFLVRLVDADNRVVYYPRLLVYHPDKVTRVTRATIARAASYARGRGAFFRLNRYPLPVVANAIFRASAGCGVKLLQLQPMRSAYYFATAVGICRGLCMTRAEAAELTRAAPAQGGLHVHG
jgi:glycosyltransferase involved in cell wall biosynthesis